MRFSISDVSHALLSCVSIWLTTYAGCFPTLITVAADPRNLLLCLPLSGPRMPPVSSGKTPWASTRPTSPKRIPRSASLAAHPRPHLAGRRQVTLADDSVPRLAACGDIGFSWTSLASMAYRLACYGILPILAGVSTCKCLPISPGRLGHRGGRKPLTCDLHSELLKHPLYASVPSEGEKPLHMLDAIHYEPRSTRFSHRDRATMTDTQPQFPYYRTLWMGEPRIPPPECVFPQG